MQVGKQFEYNPTSGRPFPLAAHAWGFVSRAYSNALSDPHPVFLDPSPGQQHVQHSI